jgi:hypothetical protein
MWTLREALYVFSGSLPMTTDIGNDPWPRARAPISWIVPIFPNAVFDVRSEVRTTK